MIRTKVYVMRCLTALAVFSGFGGAPSQAAPQRTCSIDMDKRADASLTMASASWSSLLKHQRTFAACDDGYLAEGYSNAVVGLFAHRWDHFGEYVALSERHPAFGLWAVRHIDATATDDELRSVMRNAANCIGDVKTKAVCKAVGQAAADALAEWKQLQED